MPSTETETISAKVLRYLEGRLGANVFATDIARDLGVERSQVISAVGALRRKPDMQIETPTRGVYNYRGRLTPDSASTNGSNGSHTHPRVPAAQGDLCFETVSAIDEGRMLIRADNGSLWVAKQLDV